MVRTTDKTKKKNRKNYWDLIAINKKYRNWKTILLAELIGTYLLTLWIILPSSVDFDGMNNWWGYIWTLMIMKAFWVAAFIVLIVYVLRYISVNLNPAVTIAEIAKGNDKLPIGIAKINVQFVGGIMAGFTGLGLAILTDNNTSTLDAISPLVRYYDWGNIGANGWYDNPIISKSYYDFNGGQAGFVMSTMILEFIYTFALLASIFYWDDKVSHNMRPLVIGVIVWIAVTLGVRTNNIALNPARLVGPAIAQTTSDYLISPINYTDWMWVYLISEFAAAAVFGMIELNKRNKLEI
ncbi:MAG: hypothetical protein HPPSJP_2600 [Candidatus Hepatoplasma scabrum]|nr:MAG: hypothetical protein HPPSJP_2600 [Candidatus Hepatoplasma sp.]